MKNKKAYRIVSWVIIVLLLSPLLVPLSCSDMDNSSVEASTEPTMETVVTEPPEVPEVTETTEPVTEPTQSPEPTEVTEPIEPTEPEPTETEFVSYYPYTEEELDLLARLVSSEGGNQSYETQLKIASVVMNRVTYSKFPNTIRDVIYQSGQFSVTTIKINGVVMIDRPAKESSYLAAKQVLDFGSVLPSTVMVFYSTSCTEPWVTSRATYEICDNTVFAHIYGG